MFRGTVFATVSTLLALTLPPDILAQQGPPVQRVDSPLVDTPVPGATATAAHVLFPERREATDARIGQLQAPRGFRVEVFARDLGAPRMIDAAEDGWVYVTRPDSGDVVALRDTNGDGRADARQVVVSQVPDIHGIAVADERVYLVDVNHVYGADRRADGSLGDLRTLRDDLPDGGQHPNRTLEVGPDGSLYITVGSLSNQVPAPADLEATLLRMSPDGSDLQVHAENLRNTLGFGWHPESGEMWSMDHGIDWLGDEVQQEELNRIVEGGDYGWPYCYEDRRPNPTRDAPRDRGFDSKEAYCATTEPMVLGYTAHAAPMALAFYTDDRFPEAYRGDAFVAMRGSWNRYPPSGYEVVRVDFDDGGQPRSIEPFVTGWLLEDGGAHFGRLAGVALGADGSLLVTDDTNGVLYRITYEGGS